MNGICYKQVIDFMDLVCQAAFFNVGYFLALFWVAWLFLMLLLGSLSEVELLMLFILELIVQGQLHKSVSSY
jgi:hypothetical protein